MNGRTLIVWIGLCICLSGWSGCDRTDSLQQPAARRGADGLPGPLNVVVTVGMLADLVREIGGDQVVVTQLMGEGVDPHLYRITRDDVRAVFAADLLFVSGLMLEGKMLASFQKMARRIPVIAVADRLQEQRKLPPLPETEVDPHVWMDLSLWAETLPIIADGLAALRPAAATDFHQRAETLRDELLTLHQYGQQVIASIPADRRYLVTSHDAFAYFGRAYGLEVTAVQGLSTESEAGLRWINELVQLIVQHQIQAVFVESSVPRKSMQAVLEGVRALGHDVTIGGELFSDSAGPAGSYEGTYQGMMDHNLTVIARALGGDAPPAGFRGRLQQELNDAAK